MGEKDILDVPVSVFENAINPQVIDIKTMRDILDEIKSGKYERNISYLRSLLRNGMKGQYDEQKKKLPAFTMSAHLSTRKGNIPLSEKLVSHTNLIQVDIDNVENVRDLRQRLEKDPYVAFSFASPGGDLKLGVRIDGSKHEESFKAVAKHFLETHGITIDPKVKEIPRLCFFSHDPDLYINPEPGVIIPRQNGSASTSTKDRPLSKRFDRSVLEKRFADQALTMARLMIERSMEGQKLNELLKASRLLGGYVQGGLMTLSQARDELRAAISSKPGVRDQKTAFKAIEEGLDYGRRTPIEFEALEDERQRYLDRLLKNGPPDNPDNPDNADSSGQIRTVPDSSGQIRTNPDSSGQIRTNPDSDQRAIHEDNLRASVRAFVMESPGIFTISDVDRELSIKTRQDKKNRSDYLSELIYEGLIERDLNRRGIFRRKNNTIVEMDLLGASPSELPIDLPFGISKFVEIHEKEIILLMGETNSGKTTVIFNMIWSCLKVLESEGMLAEKPQNPDTDVKNLSPPYPPKDKNKNIKTNTITNSKNHSHRYGLRYFSSEMGPTGVRKKLEAFGDDYPISDWVKYVVSVERNGNFQDVLDPDGLNFIDYLEVFAGEYFKLSSDITSIFSTLNTGIAVIAIQKKSGTDIGRGGEATLEKPRLAISLSDNKDKGYSTVKIIKAKHYRDRNPVGLEKDFIIRRHGTKIVEVSQWGYARDHQARRNTMSYHEWD